MPEKINRVAAGLLATIDNRQAQQTPGELRDDVQSTLDMRAYLESNVGIEIAQVVQGGVNAVGDWATIQVPDGELWSVRAITALFVAGAIADRVDPGINIYNLPGLPTSPGIMLGSIALPISGTSAGQEFDADVKFDQGLLLRGGTIITARAKSITGGPLVSRITVMFAQLTL